MKGMRVFGTILFKFWIPSLYFSSACYQFFFTWLYSALKQKQLNQQTSQLLCRMHPSFFCRFAKVSAAWITVDIGLLCPAASRQGVIILCKAVEATQTSFLLNPKIKEECRRCVCRWEVYTQQKKNNSKKTRLNF